MRGDIPAPALRLLAQLPSRIHEQERGPERGENMRRNHWNIGRTGKPPRLLTASRSPNVVNGRGRGGANRRALTIEGITYKSMCAAREHHHVGRKTINAWLRTGKAKYEQIR